LPPVIAYGQRQVARQALGLIEPSTGLMGYAAGYREGTRLEKIAILPPWLAFQCLFAVTFAIAQRLAR
jgi:hypothetical protein